MRRAMVVAPLLVVGLLAIGCTDSSPAAPTAPSPAAPPAFGVTIRSGVEGLPPLAGATVQAGAARLTTDQNGQVAVPLSALSLDDLYTVTAPGHVGYVSRLGLGTTATLWPLVDGTTTDWVFLYSYATDYAVEFLKRPVSDVRVEIPPSLQRARTAWTTAAGLVSDAIASGAANAPAVRIVDGAPDALLMVTAGSPCPRSACLPVTPARIEATDYALEVLAALTGFDLAGSRRRLGLAANTFVLTPVERTALRMRFLRVPGTIWDGNNRESDWQIVDETGNVRNR